MKQTFLRALSSNRQNVTPGGSGEASSEGDGVAALQRWSEAVSTFVVSRQRDGVQGTGEKQ